MHVTHKLCELPGCRLAIEHMGCSFAKQCMHVVTAWCIIHT